MVSRFFLILERFFVTFFNFEHCFASNNPRIVVGSY